MSKVREYLRGIGKRVYADHPGEVATIQAAKAVACRLQSFPAALGTSPEDHRRGVVRFGPRWYYPQSPEEAAVLRHANAAVERIKAAVLSATTAARLKVRFVDTPSPGRILI